MGKGKEMQCPRCNKANASENRYCAHCGALLKGTAGLASEPAMGSSAAPATPCLATSCEAVEGTEVMLAAIAANGVQKLFFNGGTDNYHFMEYVAKFKALGRATPDLVMTTHEHTGLCAATGYFQWTRQPQLLLLHTALGTIQPGAAWDEAWRTRAGIVALAGSVGQTTKDELAYATRGGIQFSQEVYSQETILGPYAKWAYKIERPENAALIINRAFQMAGSEPCGVSYLTYPLEVAQAPLGQGLVYDPADFALANLGEGDSSAIREAAKLLVQAKNPVVLVKGMGRHAEAVPHLIRLVEKLALPIVSFDKYMNFPKSHWANSTPGLNGRDVILVIDNDVPWTTSDPPKTTRIINLDADPIQSQYPYRSTHPAFVR